MQINRSYPTKFLQTDWGRKFKEINHIAATNHISLAIGLKNIN
jgi:hypothetical protein